MSDTQKQPYVEPKLVKHEQIQEVTAGGSMIVPSGLPNHTG